MKKVTWISIVLFVLLWYFVSKSWLQDKNSTFIFSDRDKTSVFPTPKTSSFEMGSEVEVKEPVATEEPTLQVKSASDTSIIKF